MSDYDNGARRARLRLGAVVLGLAVVVGGLGALALALLGTDGPKSGAAASAPATSAEPSRPAASTVQVVMTPEKAEKVTLDAPTGQKDGVSTGFAHTAKGALSAAVYFWEEYAFLDDSKARQQLKAVVAGGSGDLVDRRISDVRKIREAAGLPPSGGTPAGISFATSVNAARLRSLDAKGDAVQVWLNYDRYATKSDGGADESPFRDEDTDLVLQWQKGAWRMADDSAFRAGLSYPVAYAPTSTHAWADGWVQVHHDD
ncbi:hypothetical protein LMJ38_23765 [Streptomyces sp. R1]|uniref:hypothetical protein n=1 Tax=Streptomyces sp. R1 TaxID=1509279 RepID=UPI001E4E5599|nr:hypothetical protein [Streptomyces sp. R1]MCC8338940.1 hypothetical protein [Streptomyces sp. R1]